jgi:nicotinamidase-related amidase
MERIRKEDVVLVVIDVQGKLARLVSRHEALIAQLGTLIRGCRAMGVPVVWTEQVPEKLGPTVPEVAGLLNGLAPLTKNSFSCCGSAEFVRRVEELNRPVVVLAGIEAHVCVYQTALDLLQSGKRVEIVQNAVCSRDEENRQVALQRLAASGAGLTTVETLLFEMQRVAEGDTFRLLNRLVR